jgi:predicted sulfurtransferase
MKRRLFQHLGKDLLGFWLLASVSGATALLINQFRDRPISLIYASKKERIEQSVARVAETNAPHPVSDNKPHVIGLREFRKIVEGRKGIVLDARPEIFHRLGHVPGALSLSREEFEKDYAKHKTLLETNKSQAIAVYCSDSGCEDSGMVAEALVRIGYQQVMVFKGGWGEWSGQKLPQEGKL